MSQGKGACNGLRGTTKRMTEECHFKQRKYVSHNAFDFFFWAKLTQSFKKKIANLRICKLSFLYRRINESLLSPWYTIKLHVVVSSADGINYRDMSCYCWNCFSLSNSRVAPAVTESATATSSLIVKKKRYCSSYPRSWRSGLSRDCSRKIWIW